MPGKHKEFRMFFQACMSPLTFAGHSLPLYFWMNLIQRLDLRIAVKRDTETVSVSNGQAVRITNCFNLSNTFAIPSSAIVWCLNTPQLLLLNTNFIVDNSNTIIYIMLGIINFNTNQNCYLRASTAWCLAINSLYS